MIPLQIYRPRRPARLETAQLRGLQFQMYRWQGTDAAPAMLLHGWGDTGETYQFLVDHLSPKRTLVACDLRGFGRTHWAQDGYWFADYLADVDAMAEWLSPAAPIDLIGHSMGGNIAMLYAGARPERIRRLVSLEGFGLPRADPQQAPRRYRRWLDEIRRSDDFASYESFEAFAHSLARRHPRTPPDRLAFIARSWGREAPEGRVVLRADPRHKRINPVLYQRDQAEACWREITAPVLFAVGEESELAKRMGEEIAPARISELLRDPTYVTVPRAGHMLHHEQPAALGELIERFLDRSASTDQRLIDRP